MSGAYATCTERSGVKDGDIVVMDNLSSHKVKGATAYFVPKGHKYTVQVLTR